MKYFIVVIFFFQLLIINAQLLNTPDSSVKIFPNWKKEDVHSVKFISNTTFTTNGQSNTSISNFTARFIVQQKDSTGYIMAWTNVNSTLATNEIAIENQVLAKMGTVTFIYRLSLVGKFLELINYEEIKIKASKVIDEMLVQTADNPTINVQYKGAKQIINTNKGLQAFLMRPIKFYGFSFGYNYTINTVHTNTLKIPNAYGGQPFDATEKVQLVKLDNKTFTCEIKTQKTVDGMQLKKAMVDYMQKINHENTPTLTDQLNNDKLEFSEHTTQTIDFKNGLIKKASFIRIMNLGIQNTTSDLEMTAIN